MKAGSICLHIMALLFVAGCNDDGSLDTNIEGIWAQEEIVEGKNRVSRLEYNFKTDNTVEVLRIELDPVSRAVLGYRSRRTGDFVVSGNTLSFSNLVSYTNDDSVAEYSALENLIQAPQSTAYDVTFHIENNRELTLTYPPCGPLGNCIESQTFSR